ncbi:hypothetical protein [Simkania sp.]|uniref:hypothetical protein n=1 Tax=Simkania sp. TaxID=34094 RepID=UPI003B52B9F0
MSSQVGQSLNDSWRKFRRCLPSKARFGLPASVALNFSSMSRFFIAHLVATLSSKYKEKLSKLIVNAMSMERRSLEEYDRCVVILKHLKRGFVPLEDPPEAHHFPPLDPDKLYQASDRDC